MEFVAASALRRPHAWKKIRSGKAVITNRGRPMAFVLPITSGTFEAVAELVSQIEASQAMQSLHASAKLKGIDNMSVEAIDAVIAEVRKRRHARRR